MLIQLSAATLRQFNIDAVDLGLFFSSKHPPVEPPPPPQQQSTSAFLIAAFSKTVSVTCRDCEKVFYRTKWFILYIRVISYDDFDKNDNVARRTIDFNDRMRSCVLVATY